MTLIINFAMLKTSCLFMFLKCYHIKQIICLLKKSALFLSFYINFKILHNNYFFHYSIRLRYNFRPLVAYY